MNLLDPNNNTPHQENSIEETGMSYRNCTNCGCRLPVNAENFYRNRDGYGNFCKACYYRVFRESHENYRKSKAGKASRAAYLANYHAKRHGVNGTLTQTDILELLEEYPVCQRCGTTENLSIDHIVPMSLGGPNTVDNTQVLCRSCNSSKSRKVWDFRHAYFC